MRFGYTHSRKETEEENQLFVLLVYIFFCFEEIVKMLSKTKLQEILQEEYRSLPAFLFSKDGAENAPQFSASVSFCGLTFHSPVRFRTLKEAENAAADAALDALLAKPDGEPMQTNAPAVPKQIQSGEIHSNLQEANKKEMLQPPGSFPSTSESGITNMLPTSGQKEQTAPALQICPHSNPNSRVQFVSPQELSASDNLERGTNTQNMGNICSTSGNDGNEKKKEQETNIATGLLGKRQRTEDLQQPEERISSFPHVCPGNYKGQLFEFAVACGLHNPTFSTICVGPPYRSRFKATVNFDGQTFESAGSFVKVRQAEHAAALAALDSFSDRVSTLVGSPIGKFLLEVKAQKEGSPLPVYMTTNEMSSFTSTVKYNGMEFKGKPSYSKRKADNNAASVAWSALKESKRSAVSTPQMRGDKGKAPVCESNSHPLIELINHLKDETTRAGSNVLAHNLPKAKRLAFQDQVKKVTMEVECLQELIRSISHGSCTFMEIPQDTDQSRIQQEKSVQNVVVDNASRWGITDSADLQSNGWGGCGNFDSRSQHRTGSQENPSIDHSLARPCTNCSRVIPQSIGQATVQQEENTQNVMDNVSRWGMPDIGDVPTDGWGGTDSFGNRGQHPTGSQANPNTNHSTARLCTKRSRGKKQFRGRYRGRSGGRFGGQSHWASPPRNFKQAPVSQWAVCSNQSGGQQETNALNGALNVRTEWELADIHDPPATEWDGWGNPENIYQPQVGSQTEWDGWGNPEDKNQPQVGSCRGFSAAHVRPSPPCSRPQLRSNASGRGGGSSLSTRRTPHTKNDKHFPRLELAISPFRANAQEENVQTEEEDDGVDWILPSSDPPGTGFLGWNNFDDRDPPPTTGIVAPCA